MEQGVLWTIILSAAACVWYLVAQGSERRQAARLAAEAAGRAALAIRAAKGEYDASLTTLKNDPTDACKREDALAKGRHYSSLTRDAQGATIYDELAIKNDLDAATAGAGLARTRAEAADRAHEPRLSSLEDLRSKGLITEDEYASRRQAILDAI